jgi:hypothetical protein
VVLRVNDPNSVLPDPLDILDLIVSLSDSFSSALEQLAVDFTGLEGLSTEELADPRLVLGLNAVVPLLSFSCLKKVDLSCFCSSAIDDAMIKAMAQSWPQLEKLYLGNEARWQIPPSLTFTGVVHLIRHCQYLRDIAISFRASLIDTNSEPFFKIILNRKITHICIGNSPIDAAIVVAVARQLHTLLPNLRSVYRFPWTLRDRHPPPPLECSDVEWRRVEELLVVLADTK